MKLLFSVLTLPVTGPLKGVVWVAEKIADQAEAELYDGDKVRGQLMELELHYDLGEISEADYLAREEALLARLRVIREREAERRRA
ncbi:MAG: gas vesicle protein GvpG [Chloroflexi bacterium]|nr:gas vesicle protein GvpG [Chloroflexota bacterium]MBU1746920.1 gas vesicle protein GvpG [Chloroflexota bacterium]MBU1878224.1 gas vesicle protein GvpG [Chloroflexota bacterium]